MSHITAIPMEHYNRGSRGGKLYLWVINLQKVRTEYNFYLFRRIFGFLQGLEGGLSGKIQLFSLRQQVTSNFDFVSCDKGEILIG